MNNELAEVNKVIKIITSCETMEQLHGAEKVMNRLNKKYTSYRGILKQAYIKTKNEIILKNR